MLSITWPQNLSGTVQISGSKNAVLPLIACGLFFKEFTLHNVPRIGDVLTFLEIIKSLNIDVSFEWNTLTMNTQGMSLEHINTDLVKKIRVGIFLFPALLKRFWKLEIPYPGGCNIGKRPIDEHLHAFKSYGYEDTGKDEIYHSPAKTMERTRHFGQIFLSRLQKTSSWWPLSDQEKLQ